MNKSDVIWFFENPTIAWLTKREEQVMRLRFEPNGELRMSLEDVARSGVERAEGDKSIPLTRERILQIQNKTLKKLRKRRMLHDGD